MTAIRIASLIGAGWLAVCMPGTLAIPAQADTAADTRAELASNADAAWPGRLGRYVFEVSRDGTPIGTQSIEIRQQGDTVTAVTESRVAVKMLGITVYRMHQVMTETFAGRRLQAVRTETRDTSGVRIAELTRNGDHWTGRVNERASEFDCDCQASAMWNVSSIGKDRIIEASQARLRRITVTDLGLENLSLPEGRVAARHFAVKGDLEREVWYDSEGNLVAAQQVGSDGSLIRQKLIADPDAPDAAKNRAGPPRPFILVR